MNGILKQIFDILASLLTKQRLVDAGAGPEALSGALTTVMDIPTGYSVEADEEKKREAIVAFCRSQLGKPYKLGIEIAPGHEADAPAQDCSELVEESYRICGMTIPDGSNFQYDFCQAVTIGKAGDLHFLWSEKWRRIGHVMIDSGQGTVIHAMAGRGVVEDSLHQWTSHPRYRGVRRHSDFSRSMEDRV